GRAEELESRRGGGRGVPQSAQYQGLMDGGVQALREGLQESAGWLRSRVQHTRVSVDHNWPAIGPQLRCGLSFVDRVGALQGDFRAFDRVLAPASGAHPRPSGAEHVDPRGSDESVLHERSLRATVPADQLRYRSE